MTPDELLQRLSFVRSGIDRAGTLRADADKMARFRGSKAARVLPVWRQRHPFDVGADGTPRPITLSDVGDEAVFLGLVEDTPWFATEVPAADQPSAGESAFRILNDVLPLLPAEQATLLAYARGMVLWHHNHQHCSRCGAPAASTEAGHSRTCTNAACGYRSFPRTDPAVITAIIHPDGEQILLGRKPEWPPNMYSTIAGFVEPGETLEETVVRETLEETGVPVTDVRYIASQPWPFPSSLMLGFRARAVTTEIRRDDEELEDVCWFSRDEVKNGGERTDPGPGLKLSHPHSISRYLIDGWAYEK